MHAAPDAARAELERYTPEDSAVLDTLERAWVPLSTSTAAADLDELHLLIYNPAAASEALRESLYATEACQALPAENTIVVNERFLREVECAVRAFGQSDSLLGSPFLTSDAQLFGLAKRLEPDPPPYLKLMRAQAGRAAADPAKEESIRRELGITALFFLAHEVGHLIRGDAGQFAAFVDPDAPLEKQEEAAAVKLCRHVDEFTAAQFSLGGFQDVAQEDTEVRKATDALRERSLETWERVEAFFTAESEADRTANAILAETLTRRAEEQPHEADHDLYLLGRGLFAAALVTWYRDLARFAAKLGEPAMNSLSQLSLRMTMGREQYVYASELFGEYHRVTILRAVLALEAAIRARSDWFEGPVGDRSIWCRKTPEQIAADQEARREWYLSETLQRYYLLARCLDTAIKIAHFGGALAWIRETDRKRGSPQLFMMQFYSIADEVNWLRSLK